MVKTYGVRDLFLRLGNDGIVLLGALFCLCSILFMSHDACASSYASAAGSALEYDSSAIEALATEDAVVSPSFEPRFYIHEGVPPVEQRIAMMLADASKKVRTLPASPQHQTTAADAKQWQEICDKAQGSHVRFYMYGGFSNVNSWIDTWLAPRLAEQFDITLERIPMDAAVFINRLLAEKAANRSQGSIDLLWINGENFRTAREEGLLHEPFAHLLPLMKNVSTAHTLWDFGYPVDGYEVPWGSAQLVLEYDSARTPHPPQSVSELLTWIQEHPGRFTYPQPPDFTGSAFVRQLCFALTGGHEQYQEPFDAEVFASRTQGFWQTLRDIKPFLWQKGRAYPHDAAMQDMLFARGEVDFSLSYHPLHAESAIRQGIYPKTVRTLVLEDGSLRNTHFVSIPFNAPNAAGAMVVANYLLSPTAQRAKLDTAHWGDMTVLDIELLSPEERAHFQHTTESNISLPLHVLQEHAIPEVSAPWLEALERGWLEEVAGISAR